MRKGMISLVLALMVVSGKPLRAEEVQVKSVEIVEVSTVFSDGLLPSANIASLSTLFNQDEANISDWIAILSASFVGMIVALGKSRKKSHK
ncbi:MAG: hypothetical protein HUJ56_10460 [Erysipelotrichaceae bacterium]|nr:hypothetical protein [Erysipelotrichaceae bacterium]